MKIIETETIWQSYSQIYRLSHLTDNSQSVVFFLHSQSSVSAFCCALGGGPSAAAATAVAADYSSCDSSSESQWSILVWVQITAAKLILV